MSGWRELSDEELFELSQECERRLGLLRSQGVGISGVEDHYMVTLLEEMAGERATAAAREKHLTWLKARLDEVEPQMRMAILRSAGAPNGKPNGHG